MAITIIKSPKSHFFHTHFENKNKIISEINTHVCEQLKWLPWSTMGVRDVNTSPLCNRLSKPILGCKIDSLSVFALPVCTFFFLLRVLSNIFPLLSHRGDPNKIRWRLFCFSLYLFSLREHIHLFSATTMNQLVPKKLSRRKCD